MAEATEAPAMIPGELRREGRCRGEATQQLIQEGGKEDKDENEGNKDEWRALRVVV
jgi:hypothetical protein